MTRHDPALRARARKLRTAGLVVADIASELGIAPSTAWVWTADMPRPPRTAWRRPTRLNPTRAQVAKSAELERAAEKAQAWVATLTPQAHYAAGLALYAGEGTKQDGRVQFVNTDPDLIAFYCAWLRRWFDIDETRLRACLYLHEDLDYPAAEQFWSALTGIPVAQFNKPYRAVANPTIRRRRHVTGCLSISYCSTTLHREIMAGIKALIKCAAADPA